MKLSRTIKTFLKPYKPFEYWTERGKVYQKEFAYSQKSTEQEQALLNYLKTISFDTVLEYRCGFGRITKLLLENFQIKKYLAIDLSPEQIINAKNNCKEFNNVSFEVSTIQDLPDDKKFDLVIGIEVLLHVPSSDINNVIRKLLGFANKHLINIDWNQEKPPKIRSPHTFIHPYKKIYEEMLNIEKVSVLPVSDHNEFIFHTEVKQ